MKASQFTEAQKAFIIKQSEDRTPVAEICRKAGISQATYFSMTGCGSTGTACTARPSVCRAP